MKIIHTSDWHLGQSFHGFDRRYFEYRSFFDQLLNTIERDSVDALLISGDIFHNYNPSNEDEKLFSEFLTRAANRFPKLQIIAVSGNHDSASKLDAVGGYCSLCDRIKIIGNLPLALEYRNGCFIKTLRTKDLIVQLKNADGTAGAYVIAMPFIRWAETLTNLEVKQNEAYTEFENYVNALYEKALDAIAEENTQNLPVIAMGHFAVSSKHQDSYKDCRGEAFNFKVIGGESCIHIPFMKKISYGALGHIHTPLKVMDNTCYCGSPLAVNFGESFDHQLLEVSFDEGGRSVIERVVLQNPVRLLRIDLSVTDTDSFIRALADFVKDQSLSVSAKSKPLEERDFVQVCVVVPAEHRSALPDIRDAFKRFEEEYSSYFRITPLKLSLLKNGEAVEFGSNGKTADELDPLEVFSLFYRQNMNGAEPDEKMNALVASYFERIRLQKADRAQD